MTDKQMLKEFDVASMDELELRLLVSAHRTRFARKQDLSRVRPCAWLIEAHIGEWKAFATRFAALVDFAAADNRNLTSLYPTIFSDQNNFLQHVSNFRRQAAAFSCIWKNRDDDAALFEIYEANTKFMAAVDAFLFQDSNNDLFNTDVQGWENELRPYWLWVDPNVSQFVFDICLSLHDLCLGAIQQETENRLHVLLSLGAEQLLNKNTHLVRNGERLQNRHQREIATLRTMIKTEYPPFRTEGYTIPLIARFLVVQDQTVRRAVKRLTRTAEFKNIDSKQGAKHYFSMTQVHAICDNVRNHSWSYGRAEKKVNKF